MSDSLRPHGLLAARLHCPWNSPGKNSGVDCHFFLQGIFLTQGSNLGLLHYRQILYCLSHQGNWCVYVCENNCKRKQQNDSGYHSIVDGPFYAEGCTGVEARLVSRHHECLQRRKGPWLSDLKGMSSLGHSTKFSNLGEGHFVLRRLEHSNAESCKASSTFSRWSIGGGRGFWKMHYCFSNLILIVLWSIYKLDSTPITTQRCRQASFLAGKRHSLYAASFRDDKIFIPMG